jgi:hypothetical protein
MVDRSVARTDAVSYTVTPPWRIEPLEIGSGAVTPPLDIWTEDVKLKVPGE